MSELETRASGERKKQKREVERQAEKKLQREGRDPSPLSVKKHARRRVKREGGWRS
jgi:hypothetical protein